MTGRWGSPEAKQRHQQMLARQRAIIAINTPARFMAKVEKVGAGCWNWTGATYRTGYGRFSYLGSDSLAHRVSHELFKGRIPEGLEIDHLCRNRRCVNPAHLEAVTSQVNSLRSECVSALNSRKTHCIRGHELAGNNLLVRIQKGRPARICRSCGRQRMREWRAALGRASSTC